MLTKKSRNKTRITSYFNNWSRCLVSVDVQAKAKRTNDFPWSIAVYLGLLLYKRRYLILATLSLNQYENVISCVNEVWSVKAKWQLICVLCIGMIPLCIEICFAPKIEKNTHTSVNRECQAIWVFTMTFKLKLQGENLDTAVYTLPQIAKIASSGIQILMLKLFYSQIHIS